MKRARGTFNLQEALGVFKIADDKSSDFSPSAGTRAGFYDKDQLQVWREDDDICPFCLVRNKDIDHIFIFVSDYEYKYLEGKTSTRFYKQGINDNQYRTRFQSETQGESDYCLKSFERRSSIIGFRNKEEAIAFRNLVMDVRNYREANNRFSKANKCDDPYPFGESWLYMDNIITSSSSYLLAIPVPDMRKVYEMTLWLSPHINAYAFSLADCSAKYLEIPLIMDKTLIKMSNKWHKRGENEKNEQPKGAYAVYSVSSDIPAAPIEDRTCSSDCNDGPLHLLVDYHGTPELSVNQLNENTLFELTDTPDTGDLTTKQDSRLTTDEIDYRKVFQDPVNLSTL